MDSRQLAERNLIFECVSGSRAHGTARPESDWDLRGVFTGERHNVMTPFYQVEQVEGPGDRTVFEASKFLKLLIEQNPSILEIAWAPDDCVTYKDPVWEVLEERRAELLSRRLKHTFAGYAHSQLKRMEGHNKWHNNPQPEEPPMARDYVKTVHNLTGSKKLNKGTPPEEGFLAVEAGSDLYLLYGAENETWTAKDGGLRTFKRPEAPSWTRERQPALIARFDRAQYKKARDNWNNYWTWKRERNPHRAALEGRHGYDTKHAMHLVRLLRSGLEALQEGVVRVRRPDAEELTAIRDGALSYDEIMAMAEDLDRRVEKAEASSPLPKSVDPAVASEVLTRMYETVWDRDHPRAPVMRNPSSLPAATDRVMFVDVEGTGYARDGEPSTCEIAAVEVSGGELTGRTFHSFVDPGVEINPYARDLHGLSEEFLADAPGFADVWARFQKFVGDTPMMAHGADNDLKILNHDLSLSDLPSLSRDRMSCTQRVAKQIFPGVNLGLDALCKVTGVNSSARSAKGHGAMIDAKLAAECWLKLATMPEYANVKEAKPKKRRERRRSPKAA